MTIKTAYIDDAILQNVYYQAIATVASKVPRIAADVRLERREFICGHTGNLSYGIGSERGISFTIFDMDGRVPIERLRMNETINENGYHSFFNLSQKIIWGSKGRPKPDADCLDGDMIMCLLADQGIQGIFLLYRLI